MNKHQICRICKPLCCLLLLLCVLAPCGAQSATTTAEVARPGIDGTRAEKDAHNQIVIIDIVIGGLND
jgi:hypothetical protein